MVDRVVVDGLEELLGREVERCLVPSRMPSVLRARSRQRSRGRLASRSDLERLRFIVDIIRDVGCSANGLFKQLDEVEKRWVIQNSEASANAMGNIL